MLSFPHFYLADENLREAVEGISAPEKEKHQFFIDVNPVNSSTFCYFSQDFPNFYQIFCDYFSK